jgi:hypothetical protein
MQAHQCATEGYLAYPTPAREPPDPDSVNRMWLIRHRLLGQIIRAAIVPVYSVLATLYYLDIRLGWLLNWLNPRPLNPWLERYRQLLEKLHDPFIVLNVMLELEWNPRLEIRRLDEFLSE